MGERDETCPVSTEGWTRRVHFVREGRGVRWDLGDDGVAVADHDVLAFRHEAARDRQLGRLVDHGDRAARLVRHVLKQVLRPPYAPRARERASLQRDTV
jgi:hypothetical protein